MTTIYLEWRGTELRAHVLNTMNVRRFADDLRANEGWLGRNLRLMGLLK